MDHHHDHGEHGGMDMPKCAMNMLWNTQIEDTCIVFSSWHISSTTSFLVSCLIIVALGIFYEYLRSFSKALDYRIALSLSKGKRKSARTRSDSDHEESSLLSGTLSKASPGTPVPTFPRLVRAVVYASTVFLSFFLMLVFMTYNAYLILAVVLGAAIGHYIFSGTINLDAVVAGSDRGMACH